MDFFLINSFLTKITTTITTTTTITLMGFDTDEINLVVFLYRMISFLELKIPVMRAHMPAEGSGRSVPAPRRIQIFSICVEGN